MSDTLLTQMHTGAGALHLAQALFGFVWLFDTKKDEGFWQLTNNLGVTRNPDAPQRLLGSKWKLATLVPVFSLLSSVNHVYSITDPKAYFKMIKQGSNPVRWAEFSLSAGIMAFIIAVLSGVDDIKPLMTLIVANFALQLTGYHVEQETASRRRTSAQRMETVGYLIFFAMWVAIFIGFFTNMSETDEERPDSIIYTIVFGLFILFLAFGIWSSMYSSGTIKSFRKMEIGYIILSLTAKLLLANLTLFGSVFSTQ